MTSYNSQVDHQGDYSIQLNTSDRRLYEIVQEIIRFAIDKGQFQNGRDTHDGIIEDDQREALVTAEPVADDPDATVVNWSDREIYNGRYAWTEEYAKAVKTGSDVKLKAKFALKEFSKTALSQDGTLLLVQLPTEFAPPKVMRFLAASSRALYIVSVDAGGTVLLECHGDDPMAAGDVITVDCGWTV